LFELISARYERRSMLITANQPFGEWGKIFPDQAMTLAAIDRLVHHATILEMNVDSYRRKEAVDKARGAGRPPTRATIKGSSHPDCRATSLRLSSPATGRGGEVAQCPRQKRKVAPKAVDGEIAQKRALACLRMEPNLRDCEKLARLAGQLSLDHDRDLYDFVVHQAGTNSPVSCSCFVAGLLPQPVDKRCEKRNMRTRARGFGPRDSSY
jgi:hypothetical protein